MGLDINALRAKLASFKGQGERSTSFWKPKEGNYVVRIVPLADRPENPFSELYFHYLGGKTQLSPITYGNRDPIQEFAEELRGDGSKENWEQAKPFFPKLRTYVPVIVRGEEDKGVRFWSFGKTVYQDLLDIISDEDYGDITDIKTGRDITITYLPKEKSDTNFAKTSVRPKPNQSALSTDAELVKKWTTDQPDLRSLFKEPTYEELTVFLKRYLDPDNQVIDSGDESVAQETLSPDVEVEDEVEKPSKSKKSTKNVVDEFEELFAS